jgi:hypothetical protein
METRLWNRTQYLQNGDTPWNGDILRKGNTLTLWQYFFRMVVSVAILYHKSFDILRNSNTFSEKNGNTSQNVKTFAEWHGMEKRFLNGNTFMEGNGNTFIK